MKNYLCNHLDNFPFFGCCHKSSNHFLLVDQKIFARTLKIFDISLLQVVENIFCHLLEAHYFQRTKEKVCFLLEVLDQL